MGEWYDVALEFEGVRETEVRARDRKEAVRLAKQMLQEDLEPVDPSIKVSEDICYVCGEAVQPDADKFSGDKPVFDTNVGGVYHLKCEGEVFEEHIHD